MASKGEESATRPEYSAVPSKSTRPKDFISTLPTREGWSTPLIQYSKYWHRPHILEEILQVQDTFTPRGDDTIIVTQPKCGTTWLKALAFAIINRGIQSFSDHPLLTVHPQRLVPFIEIPPPNAGHAYLDTLPSPRLLATHLPLSMLPHGMSSAGCRIVYLCRDPKDALVSRWHFENKIRKGFNMELEKAFAMFCEGVSECGPFWDHCLEYWKESLARPDKVIFLKYEEIKSDPVRAVTKLARFLGAPFSEEEESSGVPQEVVRLCSFETLTSLPVNQVGGFHRYVQGLGHVHLPSSAFFRKGVTGDWSNHLSQEMGETLDLIVQQKLQGSGLTF
ncbi:cytosolic sulfotransferase 5-like [Lolium perenne]|jgi:hypothetical protein|uniref:cytosolic sulfotransferase 5-like n=1 Tax=Lolium perenne TaxID=4522 RepID=UPI0021EAB1D5|nr:cytosolic sulfotransferase 5-like [Lolium perenne]